MIRRRGVPALLAVAVLLLSASGAVAKPSGEAGASADKLVVWHYFTTPGQVDALAKMAKIFNAQNPGVKVQFEFKPFAQMTQAVLAAAVAKQGPDVIIYQWGDMLKLVDSKAIRSMTPYLRKWPESKFFPASVVHGVRRGEYSQGKGAIYTIQPYVNLIAMYYNKDILDKLAINPPTTIDQFEAALAKLKANGKGGLLTDAGPGVSGWWNGMPWFFANGVNIRMRDQATIERVLTRLRSWIVKGYVPQDVTSVSTGVDTRTRWMAGDFAFMVNGNWELSTVTKDAKFNWGVVRMPSGPAGSSVYLGGEGVAIGAFAKKPELAWKFLRATWLGKKGQLLLPTIGSVPARTDLAGSSAITKARGLAPFTKSVASGKRLPITQAENAAQNLFGDTYSGVLSGQLSPASGAERLVKETPKLLGTG